MNPTELILYSYLDAGEVRAAAEQLAALRTQAPDAHLQVRIHSPGGEVFSGLALYNRLMELRGLGIKVETFVDGLAASVASIIAMAGETVYMAENAQLMVHNPWAALEGDSAELRRSADTLDEVKAALVEIYQHKTGLPAAEVAAMMDVEQYLSAEEAMQLGFVDALSPALLDRLPEPLQASLDTPGSRYRTFYARGKALTQQAQLAALAEAQAKITALEAQLANQQTLLLLEAAEKEGRIQAAQRKPLQVLAQQNPAVVSELLATLPQRANMATLSGSLKLSGASAETAHWNLRDWEKKDPEGLARLKAETPERYQALYAATYGKR